MDRRRYLRGLGAGVVLASAGCVDSLDVGRDTGLPDGFLVIAHQGGNLLRPGNTLPAFEHARDLGADLLEMDLHTTEDGEMVVIHDETVDRTTDGSGRVDELTLDELKALDAGYRFTLDGEAYPYRGQGVEVPTLRDVLEAVPDVGYLLEPKRNTVDLDQLFDLLETTGALERTVIGAFETGTVRAVRELAPQVPTGLGEGEFIEFLAMARADELRYRPPGEVVFAPRALVSDRLVDRAHRLGLVVHAWTVNDAAEMGRMIELGVDGIITDDPATLVALVRDGDRPRPSVGA